jgi:hypothetical protein
MIESDYSFFRKHGYLVRSDLLSADEVREFLDLYDGDREEFSYRWHPFGKYQHANYDALVTTLGFDRLVRHPVILERVVALMGGPVCFGEIGARHMGPYDGPAAQEWHRDRPHWRDHPLRMDYIQMMLYLTDVDDTTACFSISPESVDDPILEDREAQLKRGGRVDIHGPCGTVCLFNASVLHTATARPTAKERKSVQIYYGHRDRAFLANDSLIPPIFWNDQADPECRAFYGNVNDVTRVYGKAFGLECGVE